MPAGNGLIGMNPHRDGSRQSVEGLRHRRQQHPVAGRQCEFGAVDLTVVTSVSKDSSPSARTAIAVAHTGREHVDCFLPPYMPVRHPLYPDSHRNLSMAGLRCKADGVAGSVSGSVVHLCGGHRVRRRPTGRRHPVRARGWSSLPYRHVCPAWPPLPEDQRYTPFYDRHLKSSMEVACARWRICDRSCLT